MFGKCVAVWAINVMPLGYNVSVVTTVTSIVKPLTLTSVPHMLN